MGRSLAAVVVGLLYALALIGLTQFALFFIVPDVSESDDAPPARLVADLVCTFLASVAAGFMAAHVARQNELAHGLSVGALLLILLAVTTMVLKTQPAPEWYQLGLPVVAIPATLLGAALRARVPRPPPPTPPKSTG